jgi:hypothetical protein
MYIYGSTLIKKIFTDFRNPKDIDYVTNDIDKYNREISNIQPGTELHYIPCTPSREMSADEIYTLKVSHAIYDIHWQKTMSDIRFLQIKGCKIIPDFLQKLRLHWESVHTNKKRCDFDTEEQMFFKDKVKRITPHDDLHKIINPNPSYKFVVEGVKPIKDKFDRLPTLIKNDICFEEAYVIAIERFYSKLPFRIAYNRAQQALITRLHPIWLADWVILNWKDYFWTSKIDYYEIYETRINRKD